MGCQLEPTPETEGYEIEVRKESFYLISKYFALYEDHAGGGTVEIYTCDIPKIRAALDQVEAYLRKRK